MISTRRWLFIYAIILGCIGGCGTPRRFGDVDGRPVRITAHVERAFFSEMRSNQWHPSMGVGTGFSSNGASGIGVGLGLSFSSTSVILIGGDAVGQADIFRKELKWGDNDFIVPLRPGRTLALAVQAEGGRTGWEAISTIVVPATPGANVHIILDAQGGKVTQLEDPLAPDHRH